MRLGLAAQADPALSRRLAVITGLRLGFLVLLLAAITFFYLRGSLLAYPATMRVLLATVGAGFALAAAYSGWLRGGRRQRELAFAQLFLDQLTWTAIVYVTGGVTSGATSFYGLTCLVGAVLVGLRGALVAAGAGLVSYGALCLALQLRWLVPPADQARAVHVLPLSDVLYAGLVNGLGIVAVALLAGWLAERLRATGGALEEATARYREAERLAELGRLAAWLAHEIRNPLGSITGSIEMLRESPALPPEDRALCDIVSREAGRLNDLVGDMLDLSKPRVPQPEDVDVASIARDVVELAGHSPTATHVRIGYEGPASALARCDPAQLRQVVWNLVRNAVQASPAGAEISVHVVADGGRVLLSVRDRGPGIDPKEHRRVFDSFYTTRAHGAGIGLAVVKRIIDEHAPFGASIRLDTPPDGGARFEISLQGVAPSSAVR
jgi:signal transduction histidine kinase